MFYKTKLLGQEFTNLKDLQFPIPRATQFQPYTRVLVASPYAKTLFCLHLSFTPTLVCVHEGEFSMGADVTIAVGYVILV